MIRKIQKSGEGFDRTVSHEFEPSEELAAMAREDAQTIELNGEPELTEKMRKCRHDRLWRFSRGMPSDIIGCCDCEYWRFF
jgi:hypothetical protein